jgi:hypothetical protein
LRVKLRLGIFEVLKHGIKWRYFPESEKSRNVRLVDLDDSTVFINSVFLFDTVNNQSDTCIIGVAFVGRKIHTCDQIQRVNIPLEIVLFDNEFPNEILFILPLLFRQRINFIS